MGFSFAFIIYEVNMHMKTYFKISGLYYTNTNQLTYICLFGYYIRKTAVMTFFNTMCSIPLSIVPDNYCSC